MIKIKLMCLTLILVGSMPASAAWAGRGHGHHGHHHGHHHHGHHRGGGYGLGIGLGLLGYGLGYYGSRAPYYPRSYGYGYGYPPRGDPPNYGYAQGYGYAPVVTVPSAPPIYIQRQEVVQVQPQAQASNYWHYCQKPEGYYPYVKNCPGGWLQVAPQPAQ